MKLPAYRDRAADAAAIGNFISGAKESVSSTITAVKEGVGAAVDSGRSALNTIVDAVPAVANAAISTATAALAKAQYSGTTGNFESALENIVLTLSYYNVSADNSVNIGSPCRKTLTLSSLHGFCKCEGAKVLLDCTEYEQQAVEELLNRGIFIE